MKTLPTNAAEMIRKILADAEYPESAANRLKGILSLSDELSDDTLNAIEQELNDSLQLMKKGARMSGLQDALSMPEVQDHIKNEITTAKADAISEKEAAEQEAADLKDSLESTKDELKEVQAFADSMATKYTDMVVDAIIKAAVDLGKPEIDMEDVEGSVETYREELKKRKLESLEDKFADLKRELDTTGNGPTEGLKKDSKIEDGKQHPEDNLEDAKNDGDTEENKRQQPKELNDVNDVMSVVFQDESKEKDTDK